MNSKRHKNTMFGHLVLVFIFLICIGLDQYTKVLARKFLKGKEDVIFLPKLIKFTYLEGGNTGAAWGMFSGHAMGLLVFNGIFILLVIGLMVRTYLRIARGAFPSPSITKYYITSGVVVMILSGALGNCIDRILYGSVTDFITFIFIDFPIFNLADIFIVVGMIAIMIIFLFVINDQSFHWIFSFRPEKNQLRKEKSE